MKQKKETTPEEMQEFLKGMLEPSKKYERGENDEREDDYASLFDETFTDMDKDSNPQSTAGLQPELPLELPVAQPAYVPAALPDGTQADTNDERQAQVQTQRQEEPDTIKHRISGKQRKASLEEYKETFMPIPPIEDRKPVFLSRKVRDRLDRIVRLFGTRKMSVSGLVENIVLHHLSTYEEDIDAWRKL